MDSPVNWMYWYEDPLYLLLNISYYEPSIIRSNDGTPRSVSVLAGLTVLHVLGSKRSAATYAALASVGSRADFQ